MASSNRPDTNSPNTILIMGARCAPHSLCEDVISFYPAQNSKDPVFSGVHIQMSTQSARSQDT